MCHWVEPVVLAPKTFPKQGHIITGNTIGIGSWAWISKELFWVDGGTKGICEVMLNSLIQIVFLLYPGSFASYVSLQEHLTG